MFKVNSERYVHYNDTGQIEKISKNYDDKYDAIKVDFETIRDLIEGKESLSNYRVEYDFLDKKYQLKSIVEYQADQTVNAFMYELPDTDESREIAIIQDRKNKCWRLELDPAFLEHLKENKIETDPTTQHYSITKKYDPNVLYRLIKFDDTMIIPFKYDFEFDATPVSIYTTRKFSSYVYEVINE